MALQCEREKRDLSNVVMDQVVGAIVASRNERTSQMLVQGPLSIALALLSVQSNLTVIVRNIAALWAKAFLPCYTYSSWWQFGWCF